MVGRGSVPRLVFGFGFEMDFAIVVTKTVQTICRLRFNLVGQIFQVQHTMLNHTAEIERHFCDAVGVNLRIQRAALIVDAVDGVFVLLKSLNNRNTKATSISVHVFRLESLLFKKLIQNTGQGRLMSFAEFDFLDEVIAFPNGDYGQITAERQIDTGPARQVWQPNAFRILVIEILQRNDKNLVAGNKQRQKRRLDQRVVKTEFLDGPDVRGLKVRAVFVGDVAMIPFTQNKRRRPALVVFSAPLVKIADRISRRGNIDPVRIAVAPLECVGDRGRKRFALVQDNCHRAAVDERMPALGFRILVSTKQNDFRIVAEVLDLELIDLEKLDAILRVNLLREKFDVAPSLFVQLGIRCRSSNPVCVTLAANKKQSPNRNHDLVFSGAVRGLQRLEHRQVLRRHPLRKRIIRICIAA